MFVYMFILLFIASTMCEAFDCSSIGGFTYNEKCFGFLVGKTARWTRARNLCKKHFHPAAELAIISSSEEEKLIDEHARDIFDELEEADENSGFWVGFLPFKIEPKSFSLLGIDSTTYDRYSNWDKNASGKDLQCVYKPLPVKDEYGELQWKHGGCDLTLTPFCEVDLSFPEFLSPTLENIFTPIETNEQQTCEEDILQDLNRRIFQIGFNKAGTFSLTSFFRKNGITACHWGRGMYAATMYKNYLENKLLLDGIKNCVLLTDMESYPKIHAFIKFYKLLDKQYPNSRFILNVRDKDKWVKSRNGLFGGLYTKVTAAFHDVTVEEINDIWKDEFDIHVMDVTKYFEGRPDKLLVFDIENDDSSKMVEFFSDWYDLKGEYWEKLNQSGKKRSDASTKNN